MHSFERIVNDLHSLNIKSGDVVFIRISYKAIGKVEGGPNTVIDAILNVIGESGTLIATAFPNLIESKNKAKHCDIIYRPGMKPITGVMPVLMSERENAYFSLNPVAPYVAIGKEAKTITELHTPDTDSYFIVKHIVEHYSPKCLRVGGDVLDGTTHIAFTDGLRNTNSYQRRIAEGMYYYDQDRRIKWCERTGSAFCHKGFEAFFNKYIKNERGAVLSTGLVGDGIAMVTDMKKTTEIEEKYISKSPKILLCDDPLCSTCRASFSYSKPGPVLFLLKQIIGLMYIKPKQRVLYNIKQSLIILSGRRCQ